MSKRDYELEMSDREMEDEAFWQGVDKYMVGPEHHAYYELCDLIDHAILDVLTPDQKKLVIKRWKKFKTKK
jgi:hypothetical protein